MSAKPKTGLLEAIGKYPPFYQKVWLECLNIPKGKTITYGELAKKIGHPGASRAVGQALARNPFAPEVPCHRVVGADGKITGYSAKGGIRNKIQMLRKEKAI
jgi:O-6-methylguanine DNA methyltransferase